MQAAGQAAAPPATAARASATDDSAFWAQVVERMQPEGMLASLARHALLVGRSEGQWTLQLDPGHQVLASDDRVAALSQALSDYMGHAVRVRIVSAEGVQGTPAQRAEKARAEQVARAREAMRSDAVVRRMQETFAGSLDEESIQPRDN